MDPTIIMANRAFGYLLSQNGGELTFTPEQLGEVKGSLFVKANPETGAVTVSLLDEETTAGMMESCLQPKM